MTRNALLLAAVAFLTACAETPASPPVVASSGNAAVDGVLILVNAPSTSITFLDRDVGLDSRAAENIVRHVVGPDWGRGTADDDPIGSLDELTSIPYVKSAAVAKLVAWVVATGGVPNTNVEGVLLTDAQMQQILSVANFATLSQLDVDAGLDSRAAENIVAARPFAAIKFVTVLPYVGTTAIAKLRDYGATWTAPSTPPPGTDLATLAKTAWNQIASSADIDVLKSTYAVDPSVLPPPAKQLFDSYSQRFTWAPAQSWKFVVDGQTIWVVMDFGEEIYWNDLFDASGNLLAHGYDGDSGPSISTWDPSPYDPSRTP